MKNRIIPYGYKMENGEFKKNIEESEVIVQIFNSYINGMSYLKIAKDLTESGKAYAPNKPIWNKNMVARIIQNKNYMSGEKYPKIIDKQTFYKANNMIKIYNSSESKEIKKLKEKLYCSCGGKIRRRIKPNGQERWYCENDKSHIPISLTDKKIITQYISKLQDEKTSRTRHDFKPTLEMIGLQRELQRMINNVIIDQKQIEEKLIQIAELAYSEIIPEENVVVIAKLQKYHETNDLNVLTEIVDKIEISKENITNIKLKGDKQNE